MKLRGILMFFLVMGTGMIFANDAAEVAAVREAVMNGYVHGTHLGNTEAMAKGFHKDFQMIILTKEGTVRKMTRDEWIERIEAGKKKNPNRPKPKVHAEFPVIQVSGNAAIVRIEFWRNDKYVFTDFMSLYKFSDGWKIVAKTYQSHS